MFFEYGNDEIKYLKERDPILSKAIDKIGHIDREINTNPLSSIIEQIISQQISKEAAKTVNGRFKELSNNYDINCLKKLTVEDIKECGMSYRKAEYIKLFIESVINNDIDVDNLHNFSNEEVINEITKLKGLGIWSAEMFLIFTLLRKDIISYDDLAIRKGIIKLYGLESLSKKEFLEYKKRYGKYATIASLYLWYIAHNEI